MESSEKLDKYTVGEIDSLKEYGVKTERDYYK